MGLYSTQSKRLARMGMLQQASVQASIPASSDQDSPEDEAATKPASASKAPARKGGGS
jgi:hypothetical protein